MDARAFNQAFTLHVRSIGPESAKALARVAREGETAILTEQGSRRGVTPGTLEVVDGVKDRPFEEVRPGGIIFVGFDYRREVVAACFEELRARSPVVSGEYRDSHFAMLDGIGLPPLTVPSAEATKFAKRIVITNPLPYARKLEVGVTEGGSPFAKQVDPHIFESAARAVRRDFGEVVTIWFSFVDLENAYQLHGDTAAHGRRTTFRDRKARQALRYPAIFIEP